MESTRRQAGGARHQPARPVLDRVMHHTFGLDSEQHISPGDLPVKPLSHRALIGHGAARQFIRFDGTTLCHGPVKAELVPKVGHDTSHRGCEIGYHLTRELLDSLLHGFVPSRFGSEYRTQISRRGARVRAEREFSTSHSW